MSTATSSGTSQIGNIAGVVWHALDENGSMTAAKLVKQVGESRDLVMQAVGWLAREGKVQIEDSGRSRVISLR